MSPDVERELKKLEREAAAVLQSKPKAATLSRRYQ